MGMDNIFEQLRMMNARLGRMEENIMRIEDKLDLSISIQRNHLIRVKNGEELPDDMILMGRPYNDLTPEKAFRIYSNPDIDFLVLDVSRAEYAPPKRLDGTVRIPLEELRQRHGEISTKTLPVLVISEDGLRSIQACEELVKLGFFNVNNVSGGHKFWPGFRHPEASL